MVDIREPRPVRAQRKENLSPAKGYPEVIIGFHHGFYADADGDASMIMEDSSGRVWDLYLAGWHYQFTDRPAPAKP